MINIQYFNYDFFQDKHLERFLTAYDYLETGNIPSRIGDNMENEFKTALSELSEAKPEALVKNLPLMLDTLLKVLVQPPSIGGHAINVGPTVFEALCTLLNNVSVSIMLCFQSKIILRDFYFRNCKKLKLINILEQVFFRLTFNFNVTFNIHYRKITVRITLLV